MKYKLLLLSVFFIGVNCFADDVNAPWYQVEMLVFQRTPIPTDQVLQPEQINMPAGINKIVELTPPDSMPDESGIELPYQYLPPKDFLLGASDNILTKSSKYQVLYHIAWRQPISQDSKGVPVHIFENTPAGTIDGLLTLTDNNYLLSKLNLILYSGAANSDEVSTGFQYTKNQVLRNGKIQYFDYPMYGTLLVVKKI